MTFEDYSEEQQKTAIYPIEIALEYCTLGLCGEAGEVANLVKKIRRDCMEKEEIDEIRQKLFPELGDVLWYLSALANEAGTSLEAVAEYNLAKLKSRKARGTLKGSGDSR